MRPKEAHEKSFSWPPLEAALLIPKVSYFLKHFLGYTNKIKETDTTA
jgi:hypothetical protein